MKPFLLIQTRPEDETSDNEYQAFLKYGGLQKSQLERFRVESEPLPKIDLEKYSGIIIGGGPFNASDDNKSEQQVRVEKDMHDLLDDVVAKDFPLLGACYGVGTLVPHQHGKVSRKYGEDVGPVEITIIKDDPLLTGLPEKFEAFVGHKEACEILPTSATLLASSKACPVQMFRIKNNIYATQFHPELDGHGLETRIQIYKHHGYFPPEAADELIARGHSAIVTEPMKILQNFIKLYTKLSHRF